MSLTPGQDLGKYQILTLLGKGAMGEVYKARDKELGREVAIKVLPDAFIEDDEYLQRFEREARTLASLNHPNVGGIFGIDRTSDLCFLSLELIPGEDLNERIERGALPTEEAIEVCRQIAEGLEAAHAAGVVHRDLKPANVRVTPEGKVKVVDFGLAKATGSAHADDVLTTEVGRILGTPTYMSPEQTRGKPLDARSDVWAFGCILFECLTGQRAFYGKTIPDVLAAITERTPDWSALPAATPLRIRALLERCLDKDVRSRLQAVGEARILLERGMAAAEEADASVQLQPLQMVAAGIAILLLGAALAFGIHFVLDQPTPGLRRQLAIDLPKNLIGEILIFPELTADGSKLVFTSTSGMKSTCWVHDLETRSTLQLAPISDLGGPTFLSVDGSSLGFLDAGMLMQMRFDGSQPQKIVRMPGWGGEFYRSFFGADWDQDGRLVFVAGEPRTLYSFSPGATAATVLFTENDYEFAKDMARPRFLPGSKAVLLNLGASKTSKRHSIGVFDLEGKKFTELIKGATTPSYLRTGHLLYVHDRVLRFAHFDPDSLVLDSDSYPVPIEPIGLDNSGSAQYSIAEDEGSLVFLAGADPIKWKDILGRSQFRWKGEDQPLKPDLPACIEFNISQDGRWLALSTPIESNIEGPSQTEILLYDLNNLEAPYRRLAEGPMFLNLLFSPDSKHLAYGSWTAGGNRYFIIDIDNRDPNPVLEGKGFPSGWDPKSQFLLQYTLGEDVDISKVPLDRSEPELLLATDDIEEWGVLSPDGAWLAFLACLDGQPPNSQDLYIQSYPTSGKVERISTGGARRPQWDPSEGKLHLYYLAGGEGNTRLYAGGALNAVEFTQSKGQITWKIEEVLPETDGHRLERVGKDGCFLLMEAISGTGEYGRFIHIANFLDWLEELDRGR